jgi:hypothetical protein
MIAVSDRASVIHFISCLPECWCGAISSATKKIVGAGENRSFQHVVKIWLTGPHELTEGRRVNDRPIKKPPIFMVYFDNFFTILQIFFKPRTWESGCGQRLFQFIPDARAIMLGLPPPQPEIISGSMEHAHHPYVLLGRRVNSRWFEGVADLSGRRIFSWNVTETLEKRRQRDAALSDFLGRLQDIGLGTMKIYVSETSGYVMKAITDSLYLYGLTAVFPWAIQMLTDIRPNCTMLDATF